MSSQPIDSEALDKLRMLGGEQFLHEMIDLFLQNTPQRVSAAVQGGRDGDLKAIQMAVHSLRSSAGNLGAKGLRALAETIETLAESGRTEGLPELLAQLQSEHDAVVRVLQDMLAGATAGHR